MSTCPCCSNTLLRHIQHGSLAWFCRSCWSEMPNFEEHSRSLETPTRSKKLHPQLQSRLIVA